MYKINFFVNTNWKCETKEKKMNRNREYNYIYLYSTHHAMKLFHMHSAPYWFSPTVSHSWLVPISQLQVLSRYTSYIIVCTAIIFILHQTDASPAGWSLSALYLHSAQTHGTRMTGWVCSCFCSHVYIKHHNFGVPVLTLSHILDISDNDDGGQCYTVIVCDINHISE